MYILSEKDKRMVNVDLVRSIEVEESDYYSTHSHGWQISAICDIPDYSFRLSVFDDSNESTENRDKAMAVFRKLCDKLATTEDPRAIIDMATLI